jgi:heme exporter protein A
MESINLQCTDISKSFNGKVIFKNVNISLTEKSSLVVNGRNGSGKSTLLKVISHLIRLDKGKIELSINGNIVPKEKYFNNIGFLSPYINLYDELTGCENLNFFYDLKVLDKSSKDKDIKNLMEKVGLYKRRNDLIRNYSSGMKQRLKLAFAIINNPPLLLMDEPRTNLDEEGISVVYNIAEEQKGRGILILATNEKEDNEICDTSLNIEEYN